MTDKPLNTECDQNPVQALARPIYKQTAYQESPFHIQGAQNVLSPSKSEIDSFRCHNTLPVYYVSKEIKKSILSLWMSLQRGTCFMFVVFLYDATFGYSVLCANRKVCTAVS